MSSPAALPVTPLTDELSEVPEASVTGGWVSPVEGCGLLSPVEGEPLELTGFCEGGSLEYETPALTEGISPAARVGTEPCGRAGST